MSKADYIIRYSSRRWGASDRFLRIIDLNQLPIILEFTGLKEDALSFDTIEEAQSFLNDSLNAVRHKMYQFTKQMCDEAENILSVLDIEMRVGK